MLKSLVYQLLLWQNVEFWSDSVIGFVLALSANWFLLVYYSFECTQRCFQSF